MDDNKTCKMCLIEKIIDLKKGKDIHYSVIIKNIYKKLLTVVGEAKPAIKRTLLQCRRLKRFNIIKIGNV